MTLQLTSARGVSESSIRLRNTIEWIALLPLRNTISIARFPLESIRNSLQILPYFFNNYFSFSQWPRIFYKIKFNISLYQFLLKFFKIVCNRPKLCCWYNGKFWKMVKLNFSLKIGEMLKNVDSKFNIILTKILPIITREHINYCLHQCWKPFIFIFFNQAYSDC